MKVRLTRRATGDIADIADYLRENSPQAAIKLRARIRDLLGPLGKHPDIGTITDEPSVRRMVVHPFPYLVFYRVEGDTVSILHMGHGRRSEVDPHDL